MVFSSPIKIDFFLLFSSVKENPLFDFMPFSANFKDCKIALEKPTIHGSLKCFSALSDPWMEEFSQELKIELCMLLGSHT